METPDPHGRQRTEDNRGQWRVEQSMLDEYIKEKYAETRRLVEEAKAEHRR